MYIPEFLYKIGYAICHQIIERTFTVNGQPLPLCSRCTGIYLGMFITFGFYFLRKFLKNKNPTLPPPLLVNIFSLFFISLMVANAVSNLFGFGPQGNFIRFVTGILFGFSIPLFLIPVFNCSRRFVFQNEHIITYKEYFILLIIVVLSAFIVLLKIDLFLYLTAYFSITGLLVFALLLNISFIAVVFDEIKRFKLIPGYYLLLIGLIVTVGEFFLLSLLHSKLL